mmetsp:Transcript_13896/g.43754  ORF Transcript_13896/g.43754 Transcript_13896/m.43754 type:complete len:232 (+) Transcript_13896:83-778(+)
MYALYSCGVASFLSTGFFRIVAPDEGEGAAAAGSAASEPGVGSAFFASSMAMVAVAIQLSLTSLDVAFNINTDRLGKVRMMPCGIAGVGGTSFSDTSRRYACALYTSNFVFVCGFVMRKRSEKRIRRRGSVNPWATSTTSTQSDDSCCRRRDRSADRRNVGGSATSFSCTLATLARSSSSCCQSLTVLRALATFVSASRSGAASGCVSSVYLSSSRMSSGYLQMRCTGLMR